MSLTLPSFWNFANQYTSQFDWSPLMDNPHWVEHPHLIPHLTDKMRHTLNTMTDREVTIPFITLLDPEYPVRLKSVPFAPPVLFYSGNIELVHRPNVAILGSRRCTQRGTIRSRTLSRTFSETHNILGGLTAGIEYHAQHALLENPMMVECPIVNITTQAFVQVRGWAKRHLDHTLERGGLVLSEFDGITPYRKWQYAQRNRIIAAMTSIAIVVEARSQSGCLETATMAAEMGATVHAFSHSPNLRHGQGCNDLIEQGVSPIEDDRHGISKLNANGVDLLHTPTTLSELANHLGLSEVDTFEQLLIWKDLGQVRQRGNLWERH
jgi:DNA processing protein